MVAAEPGEADVDPSGCASLVEVLRRRAAAAPEATAYVFLEDGEREGGRLTFGALDRKAKAVATELRDRVGRGDHALLVYPPGLDYLEGFFGCLYAGVVPVPVYPPRPNRSVDRLRSILADSGAALALTTGEVLDDPRLDALDIGLDTWVRTDSVEDRRAGSWRDPGVGGDDLALLQYTSGATSDPKGVMVSHRNLLANERMIQEALEHSDASTFVSWLPIYHDMGLIGNLLQPLYVGSSCVFMSPAAFLQKPVRWLRAIDRWRGRTSGAPDFAYRLCVERVGPDERETLDLSSWRVAYNGSEPVRADTLDRFARAFAPCGFRPEAFWPCYGLAEATLLVSGGAADERPVVRHFESGGLARGKALETRPGAGGRALVGCGRPVVGMDVEVVDPEAGVPCPEGRVGEIWLRGPSVARGYWSRAAEPPVGFGAELDDTGDGSWLRTGDLGFRSAGELFLTGRLKDLIIVRGRNHYPQDLEATVEACSPVLRAGGAAACGVEVDHGERLVVFAEVERTHVRSPDPEAVARAVRESLAAEHELGLHALVLLRPGGLPRTSSGKKQRHACRRWFEGGADGALAVWRAPGGGPEAAEAIAPHAPGSPHAAEEAARGAAVAGTSLEGWLAAAVASLLSVPEASVERGQTLAGHGLDSVAATLLCHRIEEELEVEVPVADVLGGWTLGALADHLREALGDHRPDVAGPGPAGPVVRAEAVDGAPLSHGQRALWFLHQLRPDDDAYVIARAVRVVGDLDVPALARAADRLVERHAGLRTAFETRGGRPVQRVVGRRGPALVEVDARRWDDARLRHELEERARRPFDLARDPLFRLELLRRGPAEPVLVLSVHHIVSDLWSLALLMDELGALYAAAREGEEGRDEAPLPPARLDHLDFALWEAELLAGPEGERLRAFWDGHLSGGLSPLDLPVDHPALPGGPPAPAGTVRFELGPRSSGAVRDTARRFDATPYALQVAALEALLHRYTGRERFVVGTLAARRTRAEHAGIVGYLANPLALRADVSGAEPFGELLVRTRDRIRDALRHQDYPFALAVETLRPERSAARPQLLQVMAVFQRAHVLDDRGLTAFALGGPGARMKWGGLILESQELPPTSARFDLTLTLADVDGRLLGALEYRTDLFEPETARRVAGHFQSLLEAAAGDPDRPVGELPLEAPAPETGGVPGD